MWAGRFWTHRKNLCSDQICFAYAREEDEVTDTETVAW